MSLRNILDKWQAIAYAAALLITVGIQLGLFKSLQTDVAAVKGTQEAQQARAAERDVTLAAHGLKIEALNTRTTSVEARQNADHDAITSMVEKVNTIARWVDKQGEGGGGGGRPR